MNTRPLCLLAILLSWQAVTHARVFNCKSSDGHLVFQGTPCDGDTRAAGQKTSTAASQQTMTAPQKTPDGPGGNWDRQRASTPERGPSPQSVANPVPSPLSQTPSVDAERLSRRNKTIENARQPVLTETPAYKDMEAFNKTQRCNHERQQLGVVKSGRPIFSHDNKGDRRCVEDAARQAETNAAEQKVARACN